MNTTGRIGIFLLLGSMVLHSPALRSEQTTVNWQQRQYQPTFFDFNQDKIDDLLLQATSAEEQSILVMGHANSAEEKFVPKNSQELPALVAGSNWSVVDAQLLPLRRLKDGGTGLLIIFPKRQTAALFAFNGQSLDLAKPIAKYTATQWPFLKAVTDYELHAADFDSDGIDEILQLGKFSGEHQILKLQSNLSLSTQQKIQKKVKWGLQSKARMIISDFDQNGYADIFAMAKTANAKHYLILADQQGKYSATEAQEISPEIGGLPWFDESSGTLLVRRRDDQRANLLRFYNTGEQDKATDRNCVGWLYDPEKKISEEYCLASDLAVDVGDKRQLLSNNASALTLDDAAGFNTDNDPECPIVPYSALALPEKTLQPGNECQSMPLRPFSAPRMDASSYPVNQNFNVHLDSTGDPHASTYEVWAISSSNLFYSIATVVAPGADHTMPMTTVSGRLSQAGDYLVRYRSCNNNGCSGFGPAGFLNIYAAPVTHLVSANAGTGGSISPTSRNVVSGSNTSFTLTANSGFSIAGANGCGGSLSGNTYTTGAINSACSVNVSFQAVPVVHLVSASAGAGGSISPASRSVVQGSTTSFTVTANSGFKINSVSGCGGSLSGNTYSTGVINGVCNVSATFVADPVNHFVTASAGSNGSISPASRSVVQGSTTSFTVTANSGFKINTVSGCGGSLSGNTYNTGVINSACTVSASFVANPVNHTVTASAGSNGSISPASRSVVQGSTTSFTVTANSGYKINTVSGCGGSLSGV